MNAQRYWFQTDRSIAYVLASDYDALSADLAACKERLAGAYKLIEYAYDNMGGNWPAANDWLAVEDDIDAARAAGSAPAVDPERVEIARCPRCGGLPRPTLMGRTICDRCGGLDVPQPPSSTVLRQIEDLNSDSADEMQK